LDGWAADRRLLGPLLLSFLAILVWSGIDPKEYGTWAMEVAPAVIGVVLLATTYRRFPLTWLAYVLIWLHAVILIVGGHYTYAEMPLFDWLRESFDLGRNHYDRLGHFAQGFVPAIVAREILLRLSPLRPGKWLFAIVLSFCLAISAFYELIEWWAAVILGAGADSFLGTQGAVWDTQWDMFMALIGATAAQLLLARAHDQALEKRAVALA
jgi:putative membrane protein